MHPVGQSIVERYDVMYRECDNQRIVPTLVPKAQFAPYVTAAVVPLVVISIHLASQDRTLAPQMEHCNTFRLPSQLAIFSLYRVLSRYPGI